MVARLPVGSRTPRDGIRRELSDLGLPAARDRGMDEPLRVRRPRLARSRIRLGGIPRSWEGSLIPPTGIRIARNGAPPMALPVVIIERPPIGPPTPPMLPLLSPLSPITEGILPGARAREFHGPRPPKEPVIWGPEPGNRNPGGETNGLLTLNPLSRKKSRPTTGNLDMPTDPPNIGPGLPPPPPPKPENGPKLPPPN